MHPPVPDADPRSDKPRSAEGKSHRLAACLVLAAFVSVFLPAPSMGQTGKSATFDTLKESYAKKWTSEIEEPYLARKKAALMAYGKALNDLSAVSKQKGDWNTYRVVETETKRLSSEGSAPDEDAADPALAGSLRAYAKSIDDARGAADRQTVVMLKNYLVSLDTLIKELARTRKVNETKAAMEEREKAAAQLTEYESTAPEAAEAVPSPVEKPVQKLIPGAAKEFRGHHYLLIEEKMTWNDAKKACEQLGGHLVTITSKEENDFAFRLTNGKSVWIGCTDKEKEGRWKWVTGEPFFYKNWAKGQPDNFQDDPYGIFWHESPSRWADTSDRFYGPLRSLCEWDR